jgi:hypothetical protein
LPSGVYALHAWLVASPSKNPAHVITFTAPVAAAILAAAGWPLWACLLAVLASPLTVIVSYELFEWKSLSSQLDRVATSTSSWAIVDGEWAAGNFALADARHLSPAQLSTAQKATRPAKPEQLAWVELRAQWRADERGLAIDGAAWRQARQAREQAALTPLNRDWLVTAAERIEKAAFTRADLIEILGWR